ALVLSDWNFEMPYDSAVIRESIAPSGLLRCDDERQSTERQFFGGREKLHVRRIVRDRAHHRRAFEHERAQSCATRRDRRRKTAWSAADDQQVDHSPMI